jgi:predicted methyltransferase
MFNAMSQRISLVKAAQRAVAEALREGGIAVDATVGNGHDTLFLTERVGAGGRVYGFDIQHQALAATATRLQQAGLSTRAELIHAGHERMLESILAQHHGKIDALMFNLGYLPGGDKRIITVAATTLRALHCATILLAAGGVLTILAYPGHPGGEQETTSVERWCNTLESPVFFVECVTLPDRSDASPRLWVIRKIVGRISAA